MSLERPQRILQYFPPIYRVVMFAGSTTRAATMVQRDRTKSDEELCSLWRLLECSKLKKLRIFCIMIKRGGHVKLNACKASIEYVRCIHAACPTVGVTVASRDMQVEEFPSSRSSSLSQSKGSAAGSEHRLKGVRHLGVYPLFCRGACYTAFWSTSNISNQLCSLFCPPYLIRDSQYVSDKV